MRYFLLICSITCFALAIACATLNDKINGLGCDERSPLSNGTQECRTESTPKADPGFAHR